MRLFTRLSAILARAAAMFAQSSVAVPDFQPVIPHEGIQNNYGPGHTPAHVQRNARKRRNQARNRRAHRG